MMIGVGRLFPLALGFATPLGVVADVAGVVLPPNLCISPRGSTVVDLVMVCCKDVFLIYRFLILLL